MGRSEGGWDDAVVKIGGKDRTLATDGDDPIIPNRWKGDDVTRRGHCHDVITSWGKCEVHRPCSTAIQCCTTLQCTQERQVGWGSEVSRCATMTLQAQPPACRIVARRPVLERLFVLR